MTGVRSLLPSDPAIGPPDAAYMDRGRAGQVALIWEPGDNLPPTLEPGIGLILMRSTGRSEDEFSARSSARAHDRAGRGRRRARLLDRG